MLAPSRVTHIGHRIHHSTDDGTAHIQDDDHRKVVVVHLVQTKASCAQIHDGQSPRADYHALDVVRAVIGWWGFRMTGSP